MARIQFEDLQFIPQSRTKLKRRKWKENVGLDTETYQGYVKLITDSDGRVMEPESHLDLLEFLTYLKYRGKLCWYWNLAYDFSSIIKWFPIDNIRELYDTGETNLDEYHIKFLKGKFFQITRKKHHTRFYDMFNFFPTSLQFASTIYLGKSKLKDVDSSRLNTDEKYWRKYHKDIVKYCIQDAKLTKQLADYFWNLVNNTTGLLPNKPYSQGSYAQDYFLEKCFIPKIEDHPMEVIRYSYLSYYGGRFELLKRGHFDNLYIYDIKSAYPAVIAELPDFTRGEWFYTDEFNPDYLHGFYLCYVESMNEKISPFMQKFYGLNTYCNGVFTLYLTGFEIEYIRETFPSSIVQVYDGFYWVPEGKVLHPFYEEMVKLYHLKENEPDKNVKYIWKLVINSLSGKLIQRVGGRTGRLFNPIYASEMTALTRLKLLEAARLAGINNVIGFSTDSIHLTRSFVPWKTRDDHFGDFMEDFRGEGIYLLSDVYSAWNETRFKDRFRGIYVDMETEESKNKKKRIRVKDMLEEMGDEATTYFYGVSRPVHLGEVINHSSKHSILSLNIFQTSEKEININGDNKRIWERQFVSAEEALHDNHDSEPLVLGLGS